MSGTRSYKSTRRLLLELDDGSSRYGQLVDALIADAEAARAWRGLSDDPLDRERREFAAQARRAPEAAAAARCLARHLRAFPLAGEVALRSALDFHGLGLERARDSADPKFATLRFCKPLADSQAGRLADLLESLAGRLDPKKMDRGSRFLGQAIGALLYRRPPAKTTRTEDARINGLMFGTMLRLRRFIAGLDAPEKQASHEMPGGHARAGLGAIAESLACEALGFSGRKGQGLDRLKKHRRDHPGLLFIGWPASNWDARP